MERKRHARRLRLTVLLCLTLLCWAVPANAQLIGDWSGYFPNGTGADYYEHDMEVPVDGTVVLTTTADATLVSQYTVISVRDADDQAIDFSYLMTSPHTFPVRLAAGSYVVRIFRTGYGNYHIEANLAPANAGATEIENNDVIGAANTNPNNLFAGAIGYIRAKDNLDWYDYYRFTLTEDTNVHFDLTTADTLVDFDTGLSLVNGNNIAMTYTYLSAPSKTWDLHLAAGTYWLRLYIADWARYGGYTIATTTTPAVPLSSETENNDTRAAANPIPSKTLFGSIGYYRDKDAEGTEFWDNYDWFSCHVSQGGTLSIEVLSPPTLHYVNNNSISIWDGNNTRLNYNLLGGSPCSVSVNNLDAGTYYILVSVARGYGPYQINVSGNVILPRAGIPSNILLPLLLSD